MPLKPQHKRLIPCLVFYSHWSKARRNMNMMNTIQAISANESYVINSNTLAGLGCEMVETESFPAMEMTVACESFPDAFESAEVIEIEQELIMESAEVFESDDFISFDDDLMMDSAMDCMDMFDTEL